MSSSVANAVATVTKTITASAVASSTNRAAPQGGILEGAVPTHYDTKNPIVLFIVQAGIIILITRLLHFPLSRLRQPRVIAEVIGGIILGPSVMGRIPGFTKAIFPTESMPALSLAANLGLVLFLFLVGLEVDLRYLVSNWRIALSVGALGMALPFGFGAAISWGLYHEFHNEEGLLPIKFGVYLLFIGVAMAITAFPVLCRILTELKLLNTPVGVITLSAGVGNDVVGWILLALCVALVNAGTGLTALYVLLVAIGWTVFLIYAVRPAFLWALRRSGSLENGPSQGMIALTILLVLLSSFFTSIIGVHAIFGAFIVGLICPHEGGFAIKVTEKIEDLVSVLLLPLYFALSGLSTNLGLLDNGITWAYVIGVIAIAFIAKITGGTIAARLNGMVWRESLTIGVLMSCKGLVELIVLNIGLQAKILSTRTFTIFVVMALVTTFATTPIVRALYPYWYQVKLQAWKRGEIDWEGNRLNHDDDAATSDEVTLAKTESNEVRKIVAYLRLDNISGVMALCSLIAEPAPKTSAVKLHPSKQAQEDVDSLVPDHKRPLKVHGVRLLELTDRDSSVMRVSEADEYTRRDPVVNTFRAFGQLRNVAVSGALHMATEDNFAHTLSERAEASQADLLLLPWSEDGGMIESNSASNMSDKDVKTNRFTGSFAAFASRTLAQSPCSSAVLVDNGLGGTRRKGQKPALSRTLSSLSQRSMESPMPSGPAFVSSGHHIFMPFFGSSDDVLALRLVLQMARDPAVTATIVRYELPNSAHGEPELGSSSKEAVSSPKSPNITKTVLGRRPEDFATLFAQLRDSLPDVLVSRVVFETASSNLADVMEHVVVKARSECGQVARSAGDIVVVGRNDGLGIEGENTAEAKSWMDGDSGRSLGPIAGALSRGNVSASWVVVRS